MLPRVLFVADYVPPGLVYDDEPSETIPPGWWVRLDGLDADDRESEPWMYHHWIARHFGERATDHMEAVVVAGLANEHWSKTGYAPERAEAALSAAYEELNS